MLNGDWLLIAAIGIGVAVTAGWCVVIVRLIWRGHGPDADVFTY